MQMTYANLKNKMQYILSVIEVTCDTMDFDRDDQRELLSGFLSSLKVQENANGNVSLSISDFSQKINNFKLLKELKEKIEEFRRDIASALDIDEDESSLPLEFKEAVAIKMMLAMFVRFCEISKRMDCLPFDEDFMYQEMENIQELFHEISEYIDEKCKPAAPLIIQEAVEDDQENTRENQDIANRPDFFSPRFRPTPVNSENTSPADELLRKMN
ncbi:MAG: hypothetical protein SFW66_09330 [Gammaproteobacteria bacterium]|nr:hypothetical protein [Gammaproteobacteria bacterium]